MVLPQTSFSNLNGVPQKIPQHKHGVAPDNSRARVVFTLAIFANQEGLLQNNLLAPFWVCKETISSHQKGALRVRQTASGGGVARLHKFEFN